MVSSSLLSLYLSWLMHDRDIDITESRILQAYAQNGFYSVEKILEEEGSGDVDDDGAVDEQTESQHLDTTTPEEKVLSLKLLSIKSKDVESQSIAITFTKTKDAHNFLRGTAIITLNITTLVVLAFSIKASTAYLSTSPGSLFVKLLLWYTYGVICIFASIGTGCWIKLLRNLGRKRLTEEVPIRAEIVAQCAGMLFNGVSYVLENVTTGIFVVLGVVVVAMWWTAWKTWGVVKKIMGL